ncbi:MAG: YkgJ family cysteine cluster protein [Nanobdellota archaeon]
MKSDSDIILPRADSFTDVDDYLKAVRHSLGPYCMRVCKAKCCRLGQLLLAGEKQVRVISKGKMKRLYRQGLLKKRNDGRVDITLAPRGCPALTPQNTCSIFTNKQRPMICDEFPLFRRGKMVFFSSACPAVNNGLIDDVKTQLTRRDLKIIVQ